MKIHENPVKICETFRCRHVTTILGHARTRVLTLDLTPNFDLRERNARMASDDVTKRNGAKYFENKMQVISIFSGVRSFIVLKVRKVLWVIKPRRPSSAGHVVRTGVRKTSTDFTRKL
jgi:hypothetical protein